MTQDSRSRPREDPPLPRITRQGLREASRLFAYLLPYRRKFLAAQFCLLVGSLTGLAFPYFIHNIYIKINVNSRRMQSHIFEIKKVYFTSEIWFLLYISDFLNDLN